MHERNSWVTLTFENDPGCVSKSDLQIFFRALRDAGFRFSYFAVGEYGEEFSRPHYHICFFGIDFHEDRYPWKRSKGGLLYRSDTLEKHWPYGHALISELTIENAGYTARYTMKKITGDLADEHYVREINGLQVNVTPEFALMSKNPAIGLRWIQKYWRDVFPADEVIWKGKQVPVPAYYMKWLQANEPDTFEIVQANRKSFYSEKETESGLRMLQAAQARDSRTKNLKRHYEENSK